MMRNDNGLDDSQTRALPCRVSLFVAMGIGIYEKMFGLLLLVNGCNHVASCFPTAIDDTITFILNFQDLLWETLLLFLRPYLITNETTANSVL